MFTKRMFSILAVCLTLIILSVTVVAMPADDYGIAPCYVYTISSNADLSISSGTATASAKITGNAGAVTEIEVYTYLQQKNGGSWETVGRWYDTTTASSLTVNETMSVAKGYTYRVKAEYIVYAGSAREDFVKYSAEKTY